MITMKKKLTVIVTSKPKFLPEQSSPKQHSYMWSYEVTISNQSKETIQLLNRYWKITDANNTVSEVEGPGVIGLQPLIKPGTSFSYESFCQLTTPEGSMEGYYEMQTLEDEIFIVEIPKFLLVSTNKLADNSKHLH